MAKSPQYFYDENHVRTTLYQEDLSTPINWVFLPGGPGADSSYFESLLVHLDLPGNIWLIDLPGNGSNTDVEVKDFDCWIDLFPKVVAKFENPVLVGHSFGAMLPLILPELESLLKAFVILHSAPSIWMEEATSYAKQFDLPDLTAEMEVYTQNPSQETFDAALEACIPYYFPPETLAHGRALLLDCPFQYLPPVWWYGRLETVGYTATWAPQKLPTLIISGKYDCICPYTLFKNDERFARENITHLFVEDGGHFSWIENPIAVRQGFDQLIERFKEY